MADLTPPFLESQDPAPGTSGNLPTTNVFFRIVDTSAGVDLNTINVFVDDQVAVSGGVFLPDFDGPVSVISPEGLNFAVMIDPVDLFAFGSKVDVQATANDLSVLQNLMDEEYSFFITDDTTVDITAPELTLKQPPPGTGGALTDTDIDFIIEDKESGVDLFSIEVRVNGQLAYGNGSSQPGFAVTVGIIATGFSFKIRRNSDFAIGTVTVNVRATDLVGNFLDDSWSFAVRASTATGQVVPPAPRAPLPTAGRLGGGEGGGRPRRVRRPPESPNRD